MSIPKPVFWTVGFSVVVGYAGVMYLPLEATGHGQSYFNQVVSQRNAECYYQKGLYIVGQAKQQMFTMLVPFTKK